MGLRQSLKMSLLPYSSPYYARGAYPYAYGGAYPYAYGAYPYGPYGMTAEEIKKVREAQKKAVEDAIAKEKELSEKLGPYAYGPYGAAPYGYGYPGYAPGFRGYGYGYPGAYGFPY